jgi:hypothetical protein
MQQRESAKKAAASAAAVNARWQTSSSSGGGRSAPGYTRCAGASRKQHSANSCDPSSVLAR